MVSIHRPEIALDSSTFGTPAPPPVREFAHLARLLIERVHAADRAEQQRGRSRRWGWVRLAVRVSSTRRC